MTNPGHASDNRVAIRGEYVTVVQKVMWTAICNRCGADILADSEDFVAFTDPNSVEEIMGEGYWRCNCGAPLDRLEAELQAEQAEEEAEDRRQEIRGVVEQIEVRE